MEEKNDILTCNCPLCGKSMRIRRPAKEGKYKFTCTHCKQAFALTYKDERQESTPQPQEESNNVKITPPPMLQPVDPRYMTIGGLLECKTGFFSKDKVHSLHVGVVTIGRKDSVCPSDIMFDDPTISRRSLKLQIEKKKNNSTSYYTYIMTVQKATNPVIYNGEALVEGDIVELKIDDIIIIGQTKLILK